MYTMTPFPSFSIISIALCNCSPHSHRFEPNISPVMQDEWTRTNIGSSGSHSPFIRAICSSPLETCLNGINLKCPYAVGILPIPDKSIQPKEAKRTLVATKASWRTLISGLRKQAQSYLLTAKTDRTGSSVRCRRVYFSPAAFVTVSVSGHGTISPV